MRQFSNSTYTILYYTTIWSIDHQKQAIYIYSYTKIQKIKQRDRSRRSSPPILLPRSGTSSGERDSGGSIVPRRNVFRSSRSPWKASWRCITKRWRGSRVCTNLPSSSSSSSSSRRRSGERRDPRKGRETTVEYRDNNLVERPRKREEEEEEKEEGALVGSAVCCPVTEFIASSVVDAPKSRIFENPAGATTGDETRFFIESWSGKSVDGGKKRTWTKFIIHRRENPHRGRVFQSRESCWACTLCLS